MMDEETHLQFSLIDDTLSKILEELDEDQEI